MVAPTEGYYSTVERAMTKYPFDLRRSEQLMEESGFRKGQDGIYASPAEARLAPELKTNASTEYQAEMGAIAGIWREAGFNILEAVLPAAQAQDPQVRASFPSMFTHNTGTSEPVVIDQITACIPRPENRWTGGNPGGWSDVEYDHLVESFNGTLDRDQRVQQLSEMLRIHTEEVPSISLFFATQPMAHIAALRGPQLVPPGAVLGWDVHTGEFR